MINITELAKIKEDRRTNLYYEEKEYLQYIFLYAISKYAIDFVFKGGTCLRICYGLERASEDLDFNTPLNLTELKKIIHVCLKKFDLLNISYKIYSEREYEGNFRVEIRFNGPLFVDKSTSTNTLKLDFNRKKVNNTISKVIPQLFSDVPLFILIILDEKEIFAEKIRALVSRSEARDLYDVWILLNKKVEIDKKLILEKLKEENKRLSDLKLPSKEEYTNNLKQLVSFVPSYEQVKKEVLEIIKKIK